MTTVNKKGQEAITVFVIGEFGLGVHTYEGWLVEHGRHKWAQYDAAPFVTFVPVGKRNPRHWQGHYRPYCVVLRGHNLPIAPESPFEKVESGVEGVTVSRSKYTMFDDRWGTDFDTKLDAFLQSHPDVLVADYRDRSRSC